MLQRTVTYLSLIRILGACLLLYGLYVIALALTCQIEVNGAHQYAGATIFEHPLGVANFLLFGGFFRQTHRAGSHPESDPAWIAHAWPPDVDRPRHRVRESCQQAGAGGLWRVAGRALDDQRVLVEPHLMAG